MKRPGYAFLIFALTIFMLSAAPPRVHGQGRPKTVRSVVDMAGRTVELPAEIDRIGTLGSVGVLNALVEVMGEGSKIINRLPASFANSGRWRLQSEFAPQISNGALFEGANRELLIENIIMAKPDVCLVMTRELAEQLEKLGLAAVYLEWKDIEDVRKAVDLMGQVLARPDRAGRYLEYFDRKLALAQALTSGLSENDKPRVLYGNPLRFTQPHQIAEWWIARAGGRSVTSQSGVRGSLQYNMEDLLRWDPEVMILINPEEALEMRARKDYQDIRAVKNSVFHYIPTVAHTWGNRTVEQPLTVLWTLHKLHPRLLPRERLAEEIRHFYATFFLYELSEDQLNGIIGGPGHD